MGEGEQRIQRFQKLLKEARRRVKYMERYEVRNGIPPLSLLFERKPEEFLRTVMTTIEAGVVTEDFGIVLDAYVMLELVLDKEYLKELSEFKEKMEDQERKEVLRDL